MAQNDKESDEMSELRKRFEHLQRLNRQESKPRMRIHHNPPHNSKSSSSSNNYSPSQLERLEKCFLMADHDKDGKLNGIEFSYWLEKHNFPVSHLQLGHILEIADLDKDGAISFQEFLTFCQKIELEPHHSSSESDEETFYDCLEEFYASSTQLPPLIHDTIHPHHSSLHFLQEHQLASHGAEAFEAQIRDCADGNCGPERDIEAEYQARLEEIRLQSSAGFDINQLRGLLHHPREEIRQICPSKDSQKPSSSEKQVFKSELHIDIDPHNHNNDENDKVHKKDTTTVLVPINPSSSHKFDPLILENDHVEHHHHGHEEGKNIVKPETSTKTNHQEEPHPHHPKKGRNAYEAFYGTHPSELELENFEATQLAEQGWDADKTHWAP